MTPRAQQHGTLVRSVVLALGAFGLVGWISGLDAVWVRIVGAALVPQLSYAAAVLLLPDLRVHRPPRWTIRLGCVSALLALFVWFGSVVISVDVVVSPNDLWSFGQGTLSHTPYGAGHGHLLTPGVTVAFDLDPLSALGHFGLTESDGARWASQDVFWPLWALFVATAGPTWVLSRLHRERIPPGVCASCGYNLTGNVSGRCPECGNRI